MRKLILPIAGILTCLMTTAVVVWSLAQPPQPPRPAQPRIQQASAVTHFDNAVANRPATVLTTIPTRLQRQRVPAAQPATLHSYYPSTGVPAVPPELVLRQNATTRTQPEIYTETLGYPGIEYAGRIPKNGNTGNAGNANRTPLYAGRFDQVADQPNQIQLTTGLRLAQGYSNAIGPEEDLLQGAGIGVPSNSAAPATQTPAIQTPAIQTPAIQTPATTPPASTPKLPPVNLETEDLLTPTGAEPSSLPEATRPISRMPPVDPPADLRSTSPATPAPPADQPVQSELLQQAPAESQFWSKDTPPAPDEDLLQGEVGELPPPANTDSVPQTAPPTETPPQNRTPFTTGPKEPKPLPEPPKTPKKVSTSPDEPYVDPHLELYSKNCFPSAKECKTCHEEAYEEWAGSSHAYASISPMFQKFEQTIHALSMGTISHFCMRCHAPVATALAHPREGSIWDSVPAAREGVTCIACHRANEDYGKVNGERRVEMGDIHQPMYGAGYGQKLKEVIEQKSTYKVKTEPGEKGPGQNIHTKVIHFQQISDSSFCVSCHQVAVAPGIALEVVWAQYRASPACKQGITCQECHMGQEPGVAAGYTTGPVAVINGKEIDPFRKHSNHQFYGPGYSIAHPGLFPHNEKAEEWEMQEWLQFDYRQGWGTEKFEELVDDEKIKVVFPAAWSNADDRADAREIVDKNLEKLEAKRRMRHRLMENGSHLEGPIFDRQPRIGRRLNFHYDVTNMNPGHNMPSGSLGAQPQVWLNAVLTGPNGEHLWESGYLDRNGDLADLHSLEVAANRIRRDFQLFNLQTKFLITGIKGTDREMYLPINTDFDQLPFIRASGFPVTVMNHPPFIRMEGHSVPPLGTFKAKYHVPAKRMQQPGVYRLSVRMRSRAEPIYFMRFCKATPEMERNMNYWMLDYHEESFQFMVQ